MWRCVANAPILKILRTIEKSAERRRNNTKHAHNIIKSTHHKEAGGKLVSFRQVHAPTNKKNTTNTLNIRRDPDPPVRPPTQGRFRIKEKIPNFVEGERESA